MDSPQLEAAIQHAWFEQVDGKFIKIYPMRDVENGVTEEGKELIKRNFARLGQSMFEGMLNCRWKNALSQFAQKCKEHGIEWYIFGSISDAVRGIEFTPHDIDIFVHTRDFFKIKSLFKNFMIEPFVDNQGTWLVRFFGRLCISGGLFDIAADDTMNPENHEYDRVTWNGCDLYIENLQSRYQIELRRNRTDRIKAMQACLAAHKTP